VVGAILDRGVAGKLARPGAALSRLGWARNRRLAVRSGRGRQGGLCACAVVAGYVDVPIPEFRNSRNDRQ
jgi:hypothetical protein